uniref:Uncharacterized protein n=1 Tax=virus sp. ct8MV80 TaxID=2826793 RepID=A0A8S5R8L6_9VIRU|nr:MAG TPA: hypothetical protein [virus sp. ct8MV80]
MGFTCIRIHKQTYYIHRFINNNTNIFEQEIVGRDDYHIWCCCKINTPISCGL